CFVFFFLAVSIFSGAVQGRQSRGSSRNCGRFYLSNHAMQSRGSGAMQSHGSGGAVQRQELWLLQVPVAVIVFIAAAEAAMGLLQLYGGYTAHHHLFKVTGTFFNPAPYAGFMLASLPWALLLTGIKRNTII